MIEGFFFVQGVCVCVYWGVGGCDFSPAFIPFGRNFGFFLIYLFYLSKKKVAN